MPSWFDSSTVWYANIPHALKLEWFFQLIMWVRLGPDFYIFQPVFFWFRVTNMNWSNVYCSYISPVIILHTHRFVAVYLLITNWIFLKLSLGKEKVCKMVFSTYTSRRFFFRLSLIPSLSENQKQPILKSVGDYCYLAVLYSSLCSRLIATKYEDYLGKITTLTQEMYSKAQPIFSFLKSSDKSTASS